MILKRIPTIGLLAGIALCSGCRQPSVENGGRLFASYCIACHSLIPGHAQHGPSLRGYFERSPPPTVRQARRAILGGGPSMPPFREKLSSDEIDDVIAYMKTLR